METLLFKTRPKLLKTCFLELYPLCKCRDELSLTPLPTLINIGIILRSFTLLRKTDTNIE
jgi:hypothetical protein